MASRRRPGNGAQVSARWSLGRGQGAGTICACSHVGRGLAHDPGDGHSAGVAILRGEAWARWRHTVGDGSWFGRCLGPVCIAWAPEASRHSSIGRRLGRRDLRSGIPENIAFNCGYPYQYIRIPVIRPYTIYTARYFPPVLLYWSIFTLREGYPHFDTTSGVRVYGYPYTAVYTDAYGSVSYTGRGSTF